MAFRSIRMRQGLAAKRILGVGLAVGGFTIFVNTTPVWVWYASVGIALMGVGWFLYHQK